MSPDLLGSLDARARCAIEELELLILEHYPDATFEVQRGQDDPEAIHLVTTVELEDTDAILDLVLDRMMDIQIEDGVPVFVIPIRPPERVRAMLEASQKKLVPDLSVFQPHPKA